MISLSPLGSALIPIAFLLARPALSEYITNSSALHDNSKGCNCYVVDSGENSKTPEYFQYYRFFDFRNLADGPDQYVNAPPLLKDNQDEGDEDVTTHDVFASDAWTTDWGIQNWGKEASEDFPIRMQNSPGNVYISQNDDSKDPYTWLTLRTSRLDDFQSAAEIESMQKNLMYCSMRMYARVTETKGAVAGFFTFQDDENESDIEILTTDPTDKIRYTNQPALDDDGNEVPEASKAVDDLAAWNDWQTHRIDWVPGHSYWYLNDKQVAASTYSVPRKPSYVVMNMWSDGGEWSGNMSVGKHGEFEIQWIELVFNASGPVEGLDQEADRDPDDKKKRSTNLFEKRADKGCKKVCRVDGVKEIGKPEKAGAAGTSVSWGVLVFVGAVSLFLGW